MPAFTATAPGKVILFGEHAVVYGRPAIAAPVDRVRARAVVIANPLEKAGCIRFDAPDIELEANWDELDSGHPLVVAAQAVLAAVGVARSPACTIRLTSTIPVASGLGSGAAVSVALMRAFAAFLGKPLADEQVSALAFEVEKIYHGTPSGIDNTVVTFARPVFFVRGQAPETIQVPQPFTIVIGDTGVSSPTRLTVQDVYDAWQVDTQRYERLFDEVGEITRAARGEIENGNIVVLGALMDANHALLRELGVSCPALERLVNAARHAGALGAKLSGGGRGGNMIALAPEDQAMAIAAALQEAGAVRVIITPVGEKRFS